MFPPSVYAERRKRLCERLQSGVVFFLGNAESPRNYADNPYPFRQDSTFLYYFGLDIPNLIAFVDVDEEYEAIFGNDPTVEEIVWTGPQPSVHELAQQVAVHNTLPLPRLPDTLKTAGTEKRPLHFLPPYRSDHFCCLERMCGICRDRISDYVSELLIRAVVEQRSVKDSQEIAEIETALDISYEMQMTAMRISQSGMYEREVVGAIEGIASARGCLLAFPTIFSIHGETLHNHSHNNVMQDGDIVVHDSGADSPRGYASDITRTFPVSGRFTERQKQIYSIVLEAQETAIESIAPGVEFRAIHRLAAERLVAGLKELGLMKGDAAEAVEAGAHTLFFPCGVGHMMGLDVHDMEGLGEDYVGYTDTIRRRPDFGWRSLRLARPLEPGFVVTVEPGIYFIPELIDQWNAENRHAQFINYERVEHYTDFGGIRIEDDVLVTEEGCRVLGKRIPKTIDEVEAAASA